MGAFIFFLSFQHTFKNDGKGHVNGGTVAVASDIRHHCELRKIFGLAFQNGHFVKEISKLVW